MKSLLILSLAAASTAACSPPHTRATADALPPLGEDLASTPIPPFASASPIDRPISVLAAQPLGAGVLDKDLPGLRARPEFSAFSRMSLRQLQGLSGGRLSVSHLQRVDSDLRAAFKAPELRPRIAIPG